MKVFNTLTRKKEEFTPQNPPKVKMYACGPTVYNYVHIGNLRTFLFEDILRRWLEYNNYKVTLVKNLTDVDDKTIRDSQKEKMSLKEFTTKYTNAFFEDTDTLKIERAHIYPKATEHITEMIQMIQNLLDIGVAYKTDDGVYYSISKFKDYGKLAGINKDQLKEGASGRVKKDEYDKENASDFALWKFWDKEDGDVYWEAPFGKGRPGWHIECSAMSAKHLTKMFNKGYDPEKFETIDIHTGGVDLIFPHHQDEIAQTEACTNTPFTKYWMHAEHLLVDNKKMSKSLGNFYTLRDLLKKGYNPLAIRYLLLSTHYRQKLNFTFESLEASTVAVQRINDFVLKLDEAKGKDNKEVETLIEKAKKQFEDALNDDLEMSTALAAAFEFMNAINKIELSKKDAKKVREFMKKIDSILGILAEEEKLPANIAKLVKEREEARASKNFKLADELRDELKKHGIAVEDTPNGQRWKRILSK
jgi:cysteinyl-tRNA synthetase